MNELDIDPARIESVLYYGGFSISADTIQSQINELLRTTQVALRLLAVGGGATRHSGARFVDLRRQTESFIIRC